MIEDDFYATIKLKSGERVNKLIADELTMVKIFVITSMKKFLLKFEQIKLIILNL